MGIAILGLKAYVVLLIVIFIVYFVRHYLFSMNRFFGAQKVSYNDLIDDAYLSVSVFVPMHNEEKVVSNVFEALKRCAYPRNRLEVIAINDHSVDRTREIVDGYVAKAKENPEEWPTITAIHRSSGPRGKQHAINEALPLARGEVILVFDADYIPPVGILHALAVCFKDPEIGAVMGRVIPINTPVNLLTRLEDLERSGGYQVDQQARYNLGLVPQYGGTVGGFRRSVVMALGGFKGNVIAEDTELTYRLLMNGWKVAYANRAECYEEAPETWEVRARQIRRWSRGHNQVLFAYLIPVMFNRYLSFREKVDGVLLLLIYLLPLLCSGGFLVMVILLYLGELSLMTGLLPLMIAVFYGCIGNFAPFYEIGLSTMLDGTSARAFLLPFFFYYFFFSLWYTTMGACESIVDLISGRTIEWQKTERFRKS